MNYKVDSGTRTNVPRTWAEGSWARSESKRRCTPLVMNLAAISMVAVGLYYIVASGVNGKYSIFPWAAPQHSTDSTSVRSDYNAAGNSARPLHVTGQQEAAAQERLVQAEAELQREAYSKQNDAELKKLRKEVEDLESERAARHQADRQKLRQAQKEMAGLHAEVARLEATLHEQEPLHRLQGDITGNKDKVEALNKAEAQVERLETALESLQNEEEKRRRRDVLLRRRVQVLEHENVMLQHEAEEGQAVPSIHRQLVRLRQRLKQEEHGETAAAAAAASGQTAVQARLNEEKTRIDHLSREKASLEKELQQAQNTQDQLKAKLDKMAAEEGDEGGDSDNSASSTGGHGEWRSHGKRMSYEQEVQAKQRAEEERIERQANNMVSKSIETAGLDPAHQRLLHEIEQESRDKNKRADAAADRDLEARSKEIDDMLGPNSNCPGPNCMAPPPPPKFISRAAAWAANHYASRGH